MIQMPKRSVTRFFIPLIDVLILLFCIFLLMPLVENTDEEGEESGSLSQGQALELMQEVETLRAENERLRQTREVPKSLQEELERLRKEKILALKDRLVIRVLEIDPKDGTLWYHERERKQIGSQAEALALIDADRRARMGKDEMYYLILYPRDHRKTGIPSAPQEAQYERWFASVPVGYDIP